MTDNSARAAIALDDLLLSADPPPMPPISDALRERADAAKRDARALIEAATPGAQCHHPLYSNVPGWLRLGLLDTISAWAAGTARTCMHAPDPWMITTAPAWSAAWRPRLVVCTRCVALLRIPKAMDNICDGCGHACTGVDNGDPIFPVTTMMGALSYTAGACSDCHTHPEDSHAPVAAA